MSSGPDRRAPRARDAGRSLYETAVDVLLTGFAVIVPLVVTVYVLRAAYDFITGALDPFVKLLDYAGLIEGVQDVVLFQRLVNAGLVQSRVEFVRNFAATVVLVSLIVGVGLVARNRYGERLIDYFDALLMAVPGIGSVYKSFRRMSDVVVESDASNFQEVVLVEFPNEGTYVMGFVTNDSPPAVEAAADEEELRTLFLPLAPNPFMGGHLTHVPTERIRSVDMTVEEGVRAIVTSGIATPGEEGRGNDAPDLSGETMERLRRAQDYLESDR